MCGRYDNLIAREAYKGLYNAMRLPASNFPPRYNIAPTDQIPIVRVDPRDGTREVTMARWGLIPFWMKEKPKIPHINARAETVHKLPLFREAFAKRRCLIPATGFFEWEKSAPMAGSPIASSAKTCSRLPSLVCGSSRESVARRSCQLRSLSANRTRWSPECMTECR
jgi:putative SOS response-associated peptidase YedK